MITQSTAERIVAKHRAILVMEQVAERIAEWGAKISPDKHDPGVGCISVPGKVVEDVVSNRIAALRAELRYLNDAAAKEASEA